MLGRVSYQVEKDFDKKKLLEKLRNKIERNLISSDEDLKDEDDD